MVNIWALCAIQYAALHCIFLSSQHLELRKSRFRMYHPCPKVKRVERSGPGDEIRLLGSRTQDQDNYVTTLLTGIFFISLSFCSLYCMRSYYYSLESKHIQFCFLTFFFNLMLISNIFLTFLLSSHATLLRAA